MTPPGVSFVVPVLNGRRHLRDVIEAIAADARDRPFELIVVDDGSRDGSLRLLQGMAGTHGVRVLHGPRRGAAAAINVGIREARFPFIAQVDQDVVIRPGWVRTLLDALQRTDAAAAQGHYVLAPGAGLWARVMGRDLEQRYGRMRGPFVDHVCTGNTIYRASALHAVGLLDESLGYGYDNDLSYRLGAAGHRLAYCAGAHSVHYWRDDVRGYVRQQFGVGYGRLDVVRRHPRRNRGDAVSGLLMMLHAPMMLAAIALAALSGVLAAVGQPAGWSLATAGTLAGLLACERGAAGLQAWRRSGDPAALMFPVCHFARDGAWAWAMVVWAWRRLMHTAPEPGHSMRGVRGAAPRPIADDALPRMLAVIPAYNEARNLPRVIAELRRSLPSARILVVDDGSTDDTASLLPRLGVEWLRMAERVGVGGAVRAGLRFAVQQQYDYAVRIDGDGQHRARDVAALFATLVATRADACAGSRFAERRGRGGARRLGQAALGWCLSRITGRAVTDPTSGFWLFGPRALQLAARRHPTGYAEPELVLLLARHDLRVVEAPIRMRRRFSGSTSITMGRAALALARTLLAMVVVPLRGPERDRA